MNINNLKNYLCGFVMASALCLPSTLHANVVIDYTVQGISTFALPPGNGATPGDTLTLSPYGTASLDLTYNVVQVGELNPFDFFTALSGGRGGIPVSLARNLTVNGVSQSISQSAVNDYEQPYDTLTIDAGTALVFDLGAAGTLTVTPLAAGAGGPSPATVLGDHNGEIDADFLVTPGSSVPDGGLTMGMLGAAIGGLSFFRRKL